MPFQHMNMLLSDTVLAMDVCLGSSLEDLDILLPPLLVSTHIALYLFPSVFIKFLSTLTSILDPDEEKDSHCVPTPWE